MKYIKESTIYLYKFILLLFPEITKVKATKILLHPFDISSKSRNSIVSQFQTHKQRNDSSVQRKSWLLSAWYPMPSLSLLDFHNKSLLSFPIGNPDLIISACCTYVVCRLLSLTAICWDGTVPARKLTLEVRCQGNVDRQHNMTASTSTT